MMHEMAICEGIIEVLEEQAVAQQFNKIKKVWLQIGPMAGVEIEAVRFCFDAVARHTIADNAALEIVETQGEAWCIACSKSIAVKRRFDPCPDCGSFQLRVTGGDELKITNLEVS